MITFFRYAIFCTLRRTQVVQNIIQGRGYGKTSVPAKEFSQLRSVGPRSITVASTTCAVEYNYVPLVTDRAAAWTDNIMDEEEVGILCYMNNIPGFRGTLKQRYSDFVVNEIDLTGNVVRLTSLTPPPEKPSLEDATTPVNAVPQESEVALEKPVIEDADHIEAFKALVGDKDANQLKELLAKIAENKELKGLAPILLSPDSDKAHRAAVHNFFKSRLPHLVTDTVDGPGMASEKCVRIRYFTGSESGGSGQDRGSKRSSDWKEWTGSYKRQKRGEAKSTPFDSRGRDCWSKPKFLKFHLFKENKNTQDALMIIGRMLGVQPKSFSFAGTKDKRAVTTQQVTVYKQPAAKLALLNKKLMGVKVGDFSYVDKSLGLGELSGNLFTITLRNVFAEDDALISEAAESLKERGFVNYYGLQRFGSGSVPTHRVGAALLRGEWKTAVDLVLQPRDGEMPEIAEARKYYARTQDVDGALQKFPRQMGSERALLNGLKKHPGNWLLAFGCIQRTMRLMYVHSYQSYIWNHAVSHRLKTYGVDKVVEGDLVYREELEGGTTIEGIQSPLKSEKVEDTSKEGAEDDVEIPDETVDVGPEALSKVKYVTAEDVSCNKYNITDVVLPLPCSSVLYPKNSTADVYQELASKDSVELEKCSHKVKDYSISHMTGGYRCVVHKPKDFDWKIIMYDDVAESLIESDLDALTKGSDEGKEKPPAKAEGAYKALQLRFSLQPSSYATMAIRELLKTSTSVAFHKTLNEEPDKVGA